MNHSFIIVSLLLLFCTISHVNSVYLTTCARMDTPVLSKAARGLCITSCSAQNCGTGYCRKRGSRKTCVCSRCAKGGNVPLESLVKKRG